MTSDDDACPECGQRESIRWIESTPTSDTWACTGCGFEWAITVELPAPAALAEQARRGER
jgi:ribosomal protein L37AE/L43A